MKDLFEVRCIGTEHFLYGFVQCLLSTLFQMILSCRHSEWFQDAVFQFGLLAQEIGSSKLEAVRAFSIAAMFLKVD